MEAAGEEPVYSVRVDTDDHAFSAGGFINHNTECRLAPLAMHLLAGIDEDTVDFIDTYDGKTQEPAVLPARFPNLLVNGSGGIAVGMATNIPPHNLREVIDATVHLIDNPEATSDDLMQFVLGPDFPTGALIMGRSGILDAYRTGRGSIRMRAVAEIDEDAKGAQRIIVTEVPYQTSVESIGSKIEELVRERKIEGIRDARNESSRAGTRLVIDLKRDANAQVVLNLLYKHTPMQTSFGVIMLALMDGAPKVLSLSEVLNAYVAHQINVVRRRTEYRLRKAQDRAHIVEGLLRALDMLDEVIALIRGSADVETARAGLMAAPFEFSEIQANHILDMPLRRLTGLERQKLIDEFAELTATITELESILGDDVKLRNVIKAELTEIRDKFGNDRRSIITYDPGDLDTLDLIDDDECVVTLSKGGYIKTVAADAFRRQGRGGRGVTGAKLRDEDYVEHLLTTTAHSYLLFFSNRGRVYRLRAHEIPMKERTARGTALVNLIALQPGERVQAIIDTRQYEEGALPVLRHRQGRREEDADERVRLVPADGPHRHQPPGGRRARQGHPDHRQRRHLHGLPRRDDDPLLRGRRPGHGPGHVGGAGHEAEGRQRRGGGLRRGPRRRRDPARHRGRLRQADQARQVQPPGPGRSGRPGHQGHRRPGPGGRRLHGQRRGRDPGVLLGRQHHPDGGRRDLLPGPGRHRRPDRPGRNRRVRLGRGAGPRDRSRGLARRRGRRRNGARDQWRGSNVSPGAGGVPARTEGRSTTTPPLGDWLKDDPDNEVMKKRGRRMVVLRRIDLWSALKVSLALYFSIFLVFLLGAVLLWFGARSAGLIDNIETLVEDLGFAGEGTYQLKGPEILKMTAVIGPIVVVLGALATVAGVAVFNGMSRLFGGVEVTVSDGDDLGPRSKRL